MVSKQRSYNMSRIKSKDTSIEIKVRKYLYHKGFRYQKNVKTLPGTPDIYISKYNVAIFINGCFGIIIIIVNMLIFPKQIKIIGLINLKKI